MSIISNALSGSIAAQAALNAASQNIANLQTAGYTRQGVLLSSLGAGAGVRSAGNGVKCRPCCALPMRIKASKCGVPRPTRAPVRRPSLT